MIVTYANGWVTNATFDVAQWKDETMANLSFVGASTQFLTAFLNYMEANDDVDLGLIRLWATMFATGMGNDDDEYEYVNADEYE